MNNDNNKNNKNNKKANIVIFILVMCILIVMIGIGHMDLAMSKAQGVNVTMDFTPLIITGYILCAEIVIGLVTLLILGIVYGKKWKKINIAFQNKDYAFVVSNHKLCDKLKKNKKVDFLYLAMAISYLELGNNDEFLRYLGKIQGENTVGYKYFWMAVNSLMENSAERFNFWYAKIQEENYHRTSAPTILELLKKRLIDNVELTDEEQSLIDTIQFDTIKNLFNEPVQPCSPADDDSTDSFPTEGYSNDDYLAPAGDHFDTDHFDTDYNVIDSDDNGIDNYNISNSSLYNDDIEE